MGVVKGVGFVEYPEQGIYLNTRVEVCFNYNTRLTIMGTVVRDDTTEPGVAIIKLDDDRYVLSTECMYSPRSN